MDNYIPIKVIGKGTFGRALLVKSKTDDEEYIIKQIKINQMSEREKQEALNEVRVLSSFNHPNIVRYETSFVHEKNLCIVMEYAEGGDLYQAIMRQRGRLFDEEQILDWFIQLCLAMKHIHDRKILHRDLKTQNVFLTKSNTIKLGDFGIARVLKSTMEHARTLVGTPYYLSPELCEEKPYNNKSDVWSLGCVLYEMVTLKHAFEGNSMKALVGKILRGIYPPVSSRYSRELRRLIDYCLQKDPKKRPSINTILKSKFIQQRIMDKMERHHRHEHVPSSSAATTSHKRRHSDKRATAVPSKQIDKHKGQIHDRDHVIKDDANRGREVLGMLARKRDEIMKKKIALMKEEQERKRLYEERKRLREKARREAEETHAKRRAAEAYKKELEAKLRLEAIVERKRNQFQAQRQEAVEAESRAYRARKMALEKQAERESATKAALLYKQMLREKHHNHVEDRYSHGRAQQADVQGERELQKKETDDLAEYRKKVFWELRQQAEENRRRVQQQLGSETPPDNDEGDSSDIVLDRAIPDMPPSRSSSQHADARGVDAIKRPLPQSSPPAPAPISVLKRENVSVASPHKQVKFVDDPLKHQDEKGETDIPAASTFVVDIERQHPQSETPQEKDKQSYEREADLSDVDSESTNSLESESYGDDEEDDFFEDELSDVAQKFRLDGNTLRLDNVSESDSLMYRIESLKAYLDRELGEDRFIEIYQLVNDQEQDEDDDASERQMKKVLGQENIGYVSLIHQLIFCENKFNEQQ